MRHKGSHCASQAGSFCATSIQACSPPSAGTNHWDITITSLVDVSRPVQPHASASFGPPFSGLRRNPLDKKQAVHVHLEVCSLSRFCFIYTHLGLIFWRIVQIDAQLQRGIGVPTLREAVPIRAANLSLSIIWSVY
jgi:hypothetical protein